MRVVVADLLGDPVPPHSQAEPLHDIVRVAGAAYGIAVRAADGLGALQGLRVVAEEVVLGSLREGFEEGGFCGEDFDYARVQVFFEQGCFDGGRVEAACAVDEGFFPEGFAAEAVGEVEPGGGVG